MTEERKHNYVIGYKGEGQCIYGREINGGTIREYIQPLTLWQARNLSKRTFSWNNNKKIKTVIYKIVEVKP